MTRPKVLLATIVLSLLPGLAFASCYGDVHDEVTMSCVAGTVWDAEAQTCVPTTG